MALGRHLPTGLGTGATGRSALLHHVALVLLALGCACIADVGTDAADQTTERGVARYQFGASTGDRGGIEAEPDALLHGISLSTAEARIGTATGRLDNRHALLKTLIHQ